MFQVGDDGGVAVDHLIQDRPQHRLGAQRQQFRPHLQSLTRAVQLAGDTLANGDHEVAADEHADLAEVDATVGVAGGPQDYQVKIVVAVLLDFGA